MEDTRHWMKRLNWPKLHANCKIGARGSLSGRKGNPDIHSIAHEKLPFTAVILFSEFLVFFFVRSDAKQLQ